jgi:hypothetical protein
MAPLRFNADRSKQQTRRFPAASIEQAFLIRRARVSGCLVHNAGESASRW